MLSTKRLRLVHRVLALGIAVALLQAQLAAGAAGAAPRPPEADKTPQRIIVELAALPPTVVAADQARRQGRVFDRSAHRAAVEALQNSFLAALRSRGVAAEVTSTPAHLAPGRTRLPNRFEDLINAVGIEVPGSAVETIKAMPGVRHVTIDKPLKLHLDHSVQYIRASDGPGNKTIFSQGGGSPVRYDGTGQVIAVLDTGIDSTHPAFDTTKSDANFELRSGDTRPVRLSGDPYVEGVNHPKVVFALNLTGSPMIDEVGHGTHVAADAAGLKVKGPGGDTTLPDDDQIIEGVAPGALLMDYKVCTATCASTAIIQAMEDAVATEDSEDSEGNPKPVATVINMSLGSDPFGSPDDATSVAASNAVLAGAVSVASAGNSGEGNDECFASERCENSVGSPAAGRRVIAVAATNDPGIDWELDVLIKADSRYTSGAASTGSQNDTGRATAAEDEDILAVQMLGAPLPEFSLGQHYVYAGMALTDAEIPAEVSGRIALIERGGDSFTNKATRASAKGAIAAVIFNNAVGELFGIATGSPVPTFGISQANGAYLRDTLGFKSPSFNAGDSSTWETISEFPIRLGFIPNTTVFSSRGPVDDFLTLKPDITAPGELIYSASAGALGGTTRYASLDGTSFSSPQISGAAALVRQAFLDSRGEAPLPPTGLRSGAASGDQIAQSLIVPSSLVRSALTGSATNLRERDGSGVPDTDPRTLIHEIGSGLANVIAAVDIPAVMGTNDLNANGIGGPDDAFHPDFIPAHSFGENLVINTCQPSQIRSINVTLQNIAGASGGGSYSLALLDGGSTRGHVTRPISGTSGFELTLDQTSVDLASPPNSQATFTVTVNVDGTFAPTGLALAGEDDIGDPATEFLWWVVATHTDGREVRMPFYYRAVPAEAVAPVSQGECPPPPVQDAIQDDATPDRQGDLDIDGNYRISWSFPTGFANPCGFRVEETTTLVSRFSDDAEETLIAGQNARWVGDDATWISSPHPDTETQGYSVAYTDDLDTSLTMKNAVPIPTGAGAQLSFDSFENIEDNLDFGFVEVSVDGGPFETLSRYTGFFSGKRLVDLSQFAGQAVKVRFRFTSDEFFSAPLFLGWFIDNVEIRTGAFITTGDVFGSTFLLDVADQPRGTYHYWVVGLYGCEGVPTVGTHSNLQSISVANHNPVAVDDSAITPEDVPIDVNVLANDHDIDGDSLTVTTFTQGLHGAVTNQGGGVLRYAPAANYHGPDSFTYTISDGFGGTANATVSITVDSVNDNPLAVDDSAEIRYDTATPIDVLANDSDIDGDALSISAVTQGTNGSVVNNEDDLTYTPNQGFVGADAFTYTAADGNGGTDTATVTVDVGCGGLITSFMAYAPSFTGGVFVTLGDLDGDGCQEIIISTDAGGGPHVRVLRSDGLVLTEFMAYDPAFTGGVRLAAADVDGDGNDELVTAPGPGGGPHVRVLDWTGSGLTEIAGFMAFDPAFSGGLFLSGGNLTGSAADEIVVAAGEGGGPHVRILSGSGSEIAGFMAYDPSFSGGVRLATGNFDADAFDELVVAPGHGGGPHVRVIDLIGTGISEKFGFMAYDPAFTGGVFLGGGQASIADSGDEIVTGPGNGGGPHVKVFSGESAAVLSEFMAYDPAFSGGVRVAAGDPDNDGTPNVITGPGPGGGPHIQIF